MLVVGALWGGVPSLAGALVALLVVLVAGLGFACCGLVATSFARGYDFFSYFFTFWVTPMFVFSGVFFAIDRFPPAIQAAAWLLPMTHLVAIVRPLHIGAPLDPAAAALHLGYIVALAVAAFTVAYRRMHRRLFD